MNDPRHSPGPNPLRDDLATHAMNIAETLGNLAYLIRVDADDPSLVRSYADQAEERITALGNLLRSVVLSAGLKDATS